MKYIYRNFPCSTNGIKMEFCVTGVDKNKNASGILEWCFDRFDAMEVKRQMENDGNFENLKIEENIDN